MTPLKNTFAVATLLAFFWGLPWFAAILNAALGG